MGIWTEVGIVDLKVHCRIGLSSCRYFMVWNPRRGAADGPRSLQLTDDQYADGYAPRPPACDKPTYGFQ
jgi:hypothetical protein